MINYHTYHNFQLSILNSQLIKLQFSGIFWAHPINQGD